MRISQAFPSKYLRAADLGDRAHLLTITKVEMADVGQEGASDHKPVVHFQGADKGLVLNRTNADTIAIIHGDETDAWIGKQVEVYPDTVMFNGRVTPCIRVRKPMPPANGSGLGASTSGPGTQAAAAAPPAGHPADLDDEIPF